MILILMPHAHVKQIVVKDILVLHQLFTTSQFSNEIDTLNSGDENDYVYIRRFIYGMQTVINIRQ